MIVLSGALMPGPLLTVTISESSRRGASAGPLIILGHGLLELVLMVALLSGMAPFLARDDVFVAIALFGGGILLWMAISMLRSLPTLRLDFDVQAEKSKNLVMAGIMFSLVNPYWSIHTGQSGGHQSGWATSSIPSSSAYRGCWHSLPVISWPIFYGILSSLLPSPGASVSSATGSTRALSAHAPPC